MLIGKDEWPVPFPIIKDDKGWHFDLESGLDELLARRIGQNELAAIASLRALVDAEEDYRAIDRDGDEVLEYAQKFRSTHRPLGIHSAHRFLAAVEPDDAWRLSPARAVRGQ